MRFGWQFVCAALLWHVPVLGAKPPERSQSLRTAHGSVPTAVSELHASGTSHEAFLHDSILAHVANKLHSATKQGPTNGKPDGKISNWGAHLAKPIDKVDKTTDKGKADKAKDKDKVSKTNVKDKAPGPAPAPVPAPAPAKDKPSSNRKAYKPPNFDPRYYNNPEYYFPHGYPSGNRSQHQVDKLLWDKIGPSYQKASRPIPDCSSYDCTHRIKIFMGLTFKKLVALDQVTQTLKMVVWVRLTWPDYRLRYNASAYFRDVPLFGEGNMFYWDSESDFIPLDQDQVWLPDIQLLDAVEEPKEINKAPRVFWFDEMKLLKHGYNMAMVVPQTIEASCPMNLTAFPFDTQRCRIEFGDWSASERYFEFDTLQNGDFEWHLPEESPEFECTQVNVSRESDVYHVEDRTKFPAVVYTLQFKRFPHFYLLHFVLPLFVLVLIAQGVFWLDLRGERHSTAVTTVLAVMTVSFLTAPMLPSTNEVMWLEQFQVGCYVLTCLPIFFSMLLEHHGWRKRAILRWADAVARVVFPLLVAYFYHRQFHTVVWPSDDVAMYWFLAFNIFIFVVFFISALVSLGLMLQAALEEPAPGAKADGALDADSEAGDDAASEPAAEEVRRPKGRPLATDSAPELREAVDALRRALEAGG